MRYEQDAKLENIFLRKIYAEHLSDLDLDLLFKHLHEPLPSSFRLNKTRPEIEAICHSFRNIYLPAAAAEGLVFKEIEWLQSRLGWSIDTGRRELKKNPAYKRLYSAIAALNEAGYLYRQEEVSMIPVELLDIRANHLVLDFCAAPGSKTTQILENMHADTADTVPTGLLIANELDARRCSLLYHQAKKMESPNLLVTQNDARMFPTVFAGKFPLLFDRVLCDVPCSGDGTLRKNKGVWEEWTPSKSLGLNKIQAAILERAINLTKKDGLIVYSTCSLCPTENEAVVSYALQAHGDKIELVDVAEALPGLKRCPGLKDWSVFDSKGKAYKHYDQVPDELREKITPRHFPSPAICTQNIERCIRIYPHLQNTGGFFVAVLRKTGSDKTELKSPSRAPFAEKIMFSECTGDIEGIYPFYGIQKKKLPPFKLVLGTEAGLKRKTVFCISELAADVLSAQNPNLRFKNTGISVLRRETNAGNPNFCYRLLSSSLRLFGSCIETRKIELSRTLFERLLVEELRLDAFDPVQQEKLASFSIGTILVECLKTKLQFYSWRGHVTLTACIDKAEKIARAHIVPEKDKQ